MPGGYRKLNKGQPKAVALINEQIPLLEQISPSLGTWHAAIDLANAFFSKKNQEQFTFMRKYTSTFLSFLILCRDIIYRNIDYLDIPQTTMLVHFIGNIVLIGPGEYKPEELYMP